MPSIHTRLRLLTRLRPKTSARALAIAIQYAEPDEIDSIALSLLAHPSIEGYEALLHKYYSISLDIRAQINQGGADLSAALSRTAHGPSSQFRQCALQLIEQRRDARCLKSLARLFGDTSATREMQEVAASAVLRITRMLTGVDSPTASIPYDPRFFEDLDRTVAHAVDLYPSHRRPEVLLAAALLSHRPGPKLDAFLNDEDHPSHFALRGVLKRVDDEVVSQSALEWLNLDRLAPQLHDRIAAMAQTPYLGAMLRQIAITHLPAVRRRLSRLNQRFPASVSSETAISQFTESQQIALARWLAIIPMRMPDRVARLSDAISFQNPRARLAALRSLMTIRSSEANAAIESFCYDDNEGIARIALRHTLRTQGAEASAVLIQRLLKSPQPSVRQLAVAYLPLDSIEMLWQVWHTVEAGERVGSTPSSTPSADADETQDGIESRKLTSVLGHRVRIAARALFKRDRASVIAFLRDQLNSKERLHRLQAIAFIHTLEIAPGVELELLARAAEDDVHCTSAILSCFRSSVSPATRSALELGLGHDNPRVRANAMESLQFRADVTAQDLDDIVHTHLVSHENRVRGNAVRALHTVNADEGTRQLKTMLADSRPMHRVSALWVAERAADTACATDVAHLAHHDECEPVRTRAKRTAARLLAQMNYERMLQRQQAEANGSASALEVAAMGDDFEHPSNPPAQHTSNVDAGVEEQPHDEPVATIKIRKRSAFKTTTGAAAGAQRDPSPRSFVMTSEDNSK